MRIESTRAWLADLVARHVAGRTGADWVAEVAMVKNHATQALHSCADQVVQILGAIGFMRGTKSEHLS